MEIQRGYKALRVDKGVLKSVFAGNYTGIHFMEDLVGVIYKEGQIAYAPQGQEGLATWNTLERAVNFVRVNSKGRMVIHEATPLGKRGADLMGDSMGATYPAILLGKEVWRDEPTELDEKPKEEWVDVTKECTMQLYWNKGMQLVTSVRKDSRWDCVALLSTKWKSVSSGISLMGQTEITTGSKSSRK